MEEYSYACQPNAYFWQQHGIYSHEMLKYVLKIFFSHRKEMKSGMEN